MSSAGPLAELGESGRSIYLKGRRLRYIARPEEFMAKKQVLTLEEISAEVGRLFGTTELHARRWLDQRKTLLEALGSVRDKASALMGELVGENPLPWSRGKRKRGGKVKAVPASPLTDTPRKRRGRRKISDETRAKMRAAAQKRWAAKGSHKKGD
jgi:hypothetical protein